MLLIEGRPKDISNFEYVYEKLLTDLKKTIADTPDIRFYRCKNIDVSMLSSMLDEIFNASSQSKQRAAIQAAQQRAARQQQRITVSRAITISPMPARTSSRIIGDSRQV